MHAPEHRGRQSIRPCLAAIDEALSSALMRTERARLCTCATPAESRSLLSEPARSPCRASTRSVSTHMTFTAQQHRPGPLGSLDGDGAGDHDRTYRFGPASRAWRPASGALGWRPRASVPYAGEVEADSTPRSVAFHAVDPRSASLHGAGSSLAAAA